MMPSIAAPHLLQDWNMRLPALQTHIPRSHGRQERDLRPAARLLTASSRGENLQSRPAGGNDLAPISPWNAKGKEAIQIHKRREGILRS